MNNIIVINVVPVCPFIRALICNVVMVLGVYLVVYLEMYGR